MKTPFFCSLLVTSLLLQLPARAQAQSLPKQLDALAASYAKAGQFNGTVLVADHGKVVFTKGYGLANREWSQPNAADTKFRLGSLTKQFTSMLVMQLVEKGKLKLEAHITDYLPDYPKANGDKITIHHLLTHTSGIPNYTSQPNFEAASVLPTTPTAFLRTFSELPLEFEPGSSFHYSNSGYFLLGTIIEKVTGKTYTQVLTENILQPLHMQDTGYDLAENILPKRAAGYDKASTGVIYNTTYIDMTVPYAAGSLYSTVNDLYKWDQALYTTQLLSEAGKALLFKPFKSDYAYAWVASKAVVGKDTVALLGHSGHVNGFGTYLLRAPQDRRLVVVLDNEGGPHVKEVSMDLLRVLYHRPTTGPKPEPTAPKTIALDAAALVPYVGKYQLSPTFFITVKAQGSQLSAQATGQQPFALMATSPTRFTVQGIAAEVEFVKSTSGAVEKLILHQGGQDSPGAKVE
ncbi:serine hydrolase [Hymenobacter negativus]|uniref:Serine hydrolase n=1 Tax=Hymenobacter negativus TaxID=2795026 RepID=A0ABS3Q9K8_9BACT|nr:serine hydrolase [Hymenobacter negativus]MBO2007837.1 serine hydrolase [Hymenobacter negativus]